MSEITEAGVQAKLDKGEKLSQEETAFVMSAPPDGVAAPTETDPGKEEKIDADIDIESEDKAASGKKDEDAEKPGEKEGDETGEAEKKPEDEGKAKTSEKPAPEEKKKADEGTLHSKIEKELEKADGEEDLAEGRRGSRRLDV
jgi:hypothetical protein